MTQFTTWTTSITPDTFDPIDIYDEDEIIRNETSLSQAPLVEVDENIFIASVFTYYKIHLEEGQYALINHQNYNYIYELYDSSMEKIDPTIRLINHSNDYLSNNIFIAEASDYYLSVHGQSYDIGQFTIEKISNKITLNEDITTVDDVGELTFTLANMYDVKAFNFDVNNQVTLNITTENEGLYVYVYSNTIGVYERVELTNNTQITLTNDMFYIVSDTDGLIDVVIDITSIDAS